MCHTQGSCKRVVVPKSVPGLVTRRMLVMDFLDGTQITRLAAKMKGTCCEWGVFVCMQVFCMHAGVLYACRCFVCTAGVLYALQVFCMHHK